LPAEAELFISLFGAQGFAVAFSSFSENGSVVKDGAQRTHQLLGIFASKFGQPQRVYLGGASMGGLFAVKLAETYPDAFDGVLAACAAAGGSQLNSDYRAHVRTLFDFFYPGVLPGNAGLLPDGTDVDQQIIAAAIAAMTLNPTPAFYIAALDQTPAPYADGAELVQSIATALGANADPTDDAYQGGSYFDNQNTAHQRLPAAGAAPGNQRRRSGSAPPAALATLDHKSRRPATSR
jgi:pimeloyl-ACP methyl ester carboxylesterase